VLKHIVLIASLLVVARGVAVAGDMTKTAAPAQMEAMKAEMAKCAVCKIMLPHMDELAPMKMEVVKLSNGVALMHMVDSPAKATKLHAVCKEMSTAGESCLAMTEEQAKTQLCANCQEMRAVIKAGAAMGVGDTKMGDILVFTSNDPAVQAKINAMGEKCALMAAGM
jgi:hypothetical protein